MINFSLVGNANVGKTSLFNRITHSFEHVGNWHGVTVEKKEKTINYDSDKIKITDLPGLYSLTVYSFEEAVTRDNILFNKSDLVINVLDANNLCRNLYLTLQLLELGIPVVIVVNMLDELKKQSKTLNIDKLQKCLNVPVIAISAKYSFDSKPLIEICLNQLNKNKKADLRYLKELPLERVKSIVNDNLINSEIDCDYSLIKLLENDSFIEENLKITQSQKQQIEQLGDFQDRIAKLRYDYIEQITQGIIEKKQKNNKGREYDFSTLDKILLNKYLALPIFLLIMALIFFFTFGFLGNFLSALFDRALLRVIFSPLIHFIDKIHMYDWIKSLLIEGVIKGAMGILVFLPKLLLLFLFLAFLEDSGYISRVAFMTDGLFRKIGLSGRSVFTMLMGFGCTATAILTARGLEDSMMRKKTVLLTPFMSCSAKLPVFSAIALVFFKSPALIIFSLYVLGILCALLFAIILQNTNRFKSGKLSFVMEMPPYRFPSLERIFQLIFHNTKVFLMRVATIIFALNVILWLFSNFSLTDGFLVNGNYGISIMETFSGLIAPIFKPLGFNNWRAVTALLSGLIAKEAVISTILGLGGELIVLESNSLNAYCFLVFTLLYVPCLASLASVRKEVGIKWTIFSLLFQLLTAYVFTFLIRCVILLFVINAILAFSLVAIIIISLFSTFFIVKSIKDRGKCSNCSISCKQCKNET